MRTDEQKLPDPCVEETPPPRDPRDRKFSFINGTGVLEYKGQEATLTMKWTELPPTA
jgi:hypothetical protein